MEFAQSPAAPAMCRPVLGTTCVLLMCQLLPWAEHMQSWKPLYVICGVEFTVLYTGTLQESLEPALADSGMVV